MLLKHIRDDYQGASQADKLAAFRDGVRMIQQFVGTFAIEDEFRASFPGLLTHDTIVFAGGHGPQATPIIAFAPDGRVYTGSLEWSIGEMATGEIVFNAFRANLIAE